MKGEMNMAIHLKAARVNAGLTQADVCERLKMSKTTLTSYEKYRSKPDIETAKKLAELYGMTVDNIIWSGE